jgi:hypothetical protein
LASLTKAISPATLAAAFKGSNQQLAGAGWQKLPGGLILQWSTTGDLSDTSPGSASFVFPIAFPNSCHQVIPIELSNSSNKTVCSYTNITTTGFDLTYYRVQGTVTGSARYLAIGY